MSGPDQKKSLIQRLAEKYDEADISLLTALVLLAVAIAVIVFDKRGVIQPDRTEYSLAAILGLLGFLYAFLSLRGNTYVQSSNPWYKNITREGKVALLLLVLTLCAGGANTLVAAKHNDAKEQKQIEDERAQASNVQKLCEHGTAATLVSLQEVEQENKKVVKEQSRETAAAINEDIDRVEGRLHDFILRYGKDFSDEQLGALEALAQLVSEVEIETERQTTRLETSIDEYAAQSDALIKSTLVQIQTLTDPQVGIIRTVENRTNEARDSVLGTLNVFGSSVSERQKAIGDTLNGLAGRVTSCGSVANQVSGELAALNLRLGQVSTALNELTNRPAAPRPQPPEQVTATADSIQTAEKQ